MTVKFEDQALRTLSHWKGNFGEQVCREAKRLAALEGKAAVTLSHLRRAAKMAVETLQAAIEEDETYGDQRVA